MHVVVAVLYGFVVWSAAMLYALVLGNGWAGLLIPLMPLVVSGAAAVLLTLDLTVLGLLRAGRWVGGRLPTALARLWQRRPS